MLIEQLKRITLFPQCLLIKLKSAKTKDLAGYIAQDYIEKNWNNVFADEADNSCRAIAFAALQRVLEEENLELMNELHYRFWLVDQWLGFEVCYLDAALELDPLRTKVLFDYGFTEEDIERYKDKWRWAGINLI